MDSAAPRHNKTSKVRDNMSTQAIFLRSLSNFKNLTRINPLFGKNRQYHEPPIQSGKSFANVGERKVSTTQSDSISNKKTRLEDDFEIEQFQDILGAREIQTQEQADSDETNQSDIITDKAIKREDDIEHFEDTLRRLKVEEIQIQEQSQKDDEETNRQTLESDQKQLIILTQLQHQLKDLRDINDFYG
jgi:hypothetical protein